MQCTIDILKDVAALVALATIVYCVSTWNVTPKQVLPLSHEEAMRAYTHATREIQF